MKHGTRPQILCLLSTALYPRLFTPQLDSDLRRLGDVTFNQRDSSFSSSELAAVIPDYDIVVTGWGSPVFTDAVLDSAVRLKLIAHSAGSIKHMLPPSVFERGIQVSSAAFAMARSVAEFTLLNMLLSLRQVHRMDQQLKAGSNWEQTQRLGRDLAHQKVGIVGAGYVGRTIIQLLRALDADVFVHDPYLDAEKAAALGVTQVTLDELLAICTIVSLHAPSTEATHHMIGARELKLLQTGTILINTARSWLVDQGALLAELQSGRIFAALDVFDEEPLPSNSPFLALENVILTPHVASMSAQAHERQARITVEEVQRFITGEPLQYRVTLDMLSIIA